MNILPVLQLVALLTIANGAPVIAKKLGGRRAAFPLDFGLTFFDGRPVFGSSKTIRGIMASILVTTASAPLVGLEPAIGAIVAAAALAGDLFSSFVKRRLNFPPSSQALGLDQIPECLFPMLACRDALALTVVDIVLGVVIFFAGGLMLSRLLFRAHLRDEPY
ncbi:MAG: CDP-archaeol synthase [Bradyrhizobium sp.]|jgi:CDP-archaeol synthase|uniref:CDP-archaeol synthase n=1 Tax=Bradyrhizobium sp. TaxID=376 RepID=UPI003C7D22D4